MQQTKKYKLNLIEPSDPFLPDGLNANTQRIEDVLIDRMEGSLDAMDARVTLLEAHKMAFGSYNGTWTPTYPYENLTQFISIGFIPRFVMVWYPTGATSNVLIAYLPEMGSSYGGIQSAEDGFYVGGGANTNPHQFLAFC